MTIFDFYQIIFNKYLKKKEILCYNNLVTRTIRSLDYL